MSKFNSCLVGSLLLHDVAQGTRHSRAALAALHSWLSYCLGLLLESKRTALLNRELRRASLGQEG
jgi:hypothetical protein